MQSGSDAAPPISYLQNSNLDPLVGTALDHGFRKIWPRMADGPAHSMICLKSFQIWPGRTRENASFLRDVFLVALYVSAWIHRRS
jgi:hypothetical protein